MVVGEVKRATNIMDGIENTGDVRLHDHRLRLKQRFDIVRKLGQGTYGKVQLGINKKTGQEVAIKTIKKCKIESEADLVRIRREVQIMSSVRHPNIVHIYEVFENSEKMILVMEYCSGGELYDYLSQKKVLQEDEARRLFRQIATAVYYCHIHKICHRDLKLENVLLDQTGSAKIADFGLSNVFKETSLLSTFCGSPLYASPEIVKGTPYIGPEVDCWSLGVLLYTLVYGAMPFDGSNFKRLVRQISNGDYYEPKNPSSASPLIRDMLTVDAVKRADIAYICDHSWVNTGCETSCLEEAEVLAAETPVRLDLLLSLAPAAPGNSNAVMVPGETEMGPEESCTDLTNSASMAVEPSNSAEKRILDLVAEGGEDAIKPSPTRTIVSATDNKRKLELAMSASGLQRKKERVASCANIGSQEPLPEEALLDPTTPEEPVPEDTQVQPTLKSSATITITPSPVELTKDLTKEIVKEPPKQEEEVKEKQKPRAAVKKKVPPIKAEEKVSLEKQEEAKAEEPKPSAVSSAAERLTSLSLSAAAAAPAAAVLASPAKPKKLSIPGGNVGNFKDQFERRASLTSGQETKRPAAAAAAKTEAATKPRAGFSASKIAKPKAQSEDRDLTPKETGSVRLQQIGIEPAPTPVEESRGGVKKTESEPAHASGPADPAYLLQDARRSLQNSMAKLAEEKAGEENRRRAARDIITTAIRTGKPPVPYGRSSSAGVAALVSPASPLSPGTPASPASPASPAAAPSRVFRTEALHRVQDHRPRGVSVERIIPIHVAEESPTSPPPQPTPTPTQPSTPTLTKQASRVSHTPLRRLVSTESSASEACSSPGEPIKKSAREFIIPIAVEGKGYVTPRQRSLEPDAAAAGRLQRGPKPRRISSLVSGGESEEEEDTHMHRLRSSRAARAESVSSGEEDEEDEGFHLLTAENLFSTLLHRVRALTNRLNGEEGPGFPQHPHSLFNNLQSPFFNSPHLPRRHLFRDGWGARDLHANFDSMFNKPRPLPRGGSKKGKHQPAAADALDLSDLDLSSIQLSARELRALSGLTPALSRRLQRQLLASLPPAAATQLRRTLSLRDPPRAATPSAPGATDATDATDATERPAATTEHPTETKQRSPSVTPRDKDSPKTIEDGPASPRNKASPKTIKEGPASPRDKDLPKTIEDGPASPRDKDLPKTIEEGPASPRNKDSPKTIEDSPASPRDKDSPKTIDDGPASPRADSVARPPARLRSPEYPLDTDSVQQFCTLPRLRRRASQSRAVTSPSESESGLNSMNARITPDRSLLSKYLTPERALSLDDSSYSSEGSILSEPSYVAAYGGTGLGLRRHSMRLANDQPRRRVSRFLRSDFFDSPTDENVYEKHRKEKELETQKILREIREKKNKALDSPNVRSPISDYGDAPPTFKDEAAYTKKCLSPVSLLTVKERSRSNTPFFPILDNIKETALDVAHPIFPDKKTYGDIEEVRPKSRFDESSSIRESKLIRPKSYPVKNLDSIDEPTSTVSTDTIENESDVKDKNLQKESKLMRPKSYPTSSPSPEKVYLHRNSLKKEDTVSAKPKDGDVKSDVEVSFSITLPRKKPEVLNVVKPIANSDSNQQKVEPKADTEKTNNDSLVLRKYKIINEENKEKLDAKKENGSVVANGGPKESICKDTLVSEDKETKVLNNTTKKDEKSKASESDSTEKKGTIKKKIIKKVSSKSKTELGSSQDTSDAKSSSEKKKVIKKVKEKVIENGAKSAVVTKKKSMLQSIGQKFEKFTSTKSSSPEKASENGSVVNDSNDAVKLKRLQREQSVPVNAEPPTESNLIKRAVTLTDVAVLDTPTSSNTKTTVSKVLGLFKKFDPKEKVSKPPVEKSQSENLETDLADSKTETTTETVSDNLDKEKPRRPTSLLLNGLSRKNKYGRSTSDSVSAAAVETDEQTVLKKDNEPKNLRNTLKLDFSRLPRVKKIVPTNPVIEPQLLKHSSEDKETDRICSVEKINSLPQGDSVVENNDIESRSRSRSRSTISNSEIKSDLSADGKGVDKHSLSPSDTTIIHPLRSRDSMSPEKEDIVDRIRRKSFYPRFNEKKARRKSSLVGPGVAEYDPLARIHSPPVENKYDASPTSPSHGSYDLSPGYSVASDLSPSTERYRSLLTDLPVNTRNNLRFDSYGLNDKIDTYRSLDRNDFRKYSGSRSYLDYDQPLSYGTNRYSRTKSLLENSDGGEEHSLGHLRDPQKYNRTLSMYSPGNYATYRPKRTRNSAIILKESEKEPSPENILEKIRNRKNISISVTRKPDAKKDLLPRSNVSPQGEGDRSECSEKAD